jgi:hypothetical protein
MMALASVLGLFGLLALLLALSRLAAARGLAAAGHAVLAVLLVGAAVVTGALATDLASYQPREGDRPIAELYFEQVGTRHYRATLTRLPADECRYSSSRGTRGAWMPEPSLSVAGHARSAAGRVTGSIAWSPSNSPPTRERRCPRRAAVLPSMRATASIYGRRRVVAGAGASW